MGAVLVLGTKKGLLVLEKGARAWRSKALQHGGIEVSFAFHDARTKTFWAALDHGHWGCKLSRSKDGTSWEEVAPPRYPEGTTTPCTKKPATLRYIYALAPGHADEPQRLYAGTVPGGLFVSEDGGASFSLVDSLFNHATREKWFQAGKDFDDPGLHSVIVDPRDARHVLVGISSAGVLETRDGGKTWEPRNKGLKNPYLPDPKPEVGYDPHFMMACESEPDVIWTQTHSGVFRSTDSGKSWTDVGHEKGPVNFGFPIAADAGNPDCAWVVPATADERRYAIDGGLCVGRTDDGGKSWKVLREGLPQENCFDVAYRHALDVRGDAVAFGTTTGNLYVSEDRGESWHCLGSNFPPILSVRFVLF